MKIKNIKRDHLYRAGKFISLAAILCFPVKLVLAQDEFDAHRQKTLEEFQDFKDGRRSSKPPQKPAEATPADVPVVAPSAAPIIAPAVIPAAAKAKSAGTTFRDCPDCPEMVVIPAGSFQMGSTDEANETPVHQVVIGRAFAIGKTEITQGQWHAIMNSNPSSFHMYGNDSPVENVSWKDAQAYIRKLNEKTGKQYRLPSEAEWEYACRAGGQQKHCGKDDAHGVAWYKSKTADPRTQPVGGKQANAWGLYDMSGNVWEWVDDSYQANYEGSPVDGSAWHVDDNEKSVIRGGSWNEAASYSRAASRDSYSPNEYNNHIGFRIARPLP